MQRLRADPHQQRKVSCDHKPLNMMGIGKIPCLSNGVGQAVHPSLSTPIKRGQITTRVQGISGGVVRAFSEVDPANEFAPANDLANEPFDGIDRRAACFPFGFGLFTNLDWGKKSDVQIGGQQGMSQGWIVLQHGVLFIAESWQVLGQEMVQRHKRIGPRDGPSKRTKTAKVGRKARFDKL